MEQSQNVRARPPREIPETGRRVRRPSLERNEFLRRALEVFCEKGFDGTSIDAISTAVGIAKRTIYARYGDKENLFKVATERAIDDWNVPVERLRQAETDSLEDSLGAIGRILIENALSPAGLRLLRLTNVESGRVPAISEHNLHYGRDPIIAYVADFFRRRLTAGPRIFADANEAAEAFLDLVVGGPANAAAWGVVKDKKAIEQRAQLSVRLFVHGILSVAGDRVSEGQLQEARREMAELKTLLAEASTRLARTSNRLTAAPG